MRPFDSNRCPMVPATRFGATYSASGILRLALKAGQSAIDSAQRVQNVTKQAVEQMAERVATRIAEASAGTADASAEPDWPTWPTFPPEPPLADSGNATICPPKCLNLELLAYFLKVGWRLAVGEAGPYRGRGICMG